MIDIPLSPADSLAMGQHVYGWTHLFPPTPAPPPIFHIMRQVDDAIVGVGGRGAMRINRLLPLDSWYGKSRGFVCHNSKYAFKVLLCSEVVARELLRAWRVGVVTYLSVERVSDESRRPHQECADNPAGAIDPAGC